MKLNPNAAAFVPTFASWSAPQAPAATEEVKYCDEYEEDSYDPNYYPSDDYDGEDEISELLAEIERMQLEADMTRELETLKAQGRSEDADLWNTWMAGAPPPQDFSHQEEASPMSSYHYPSTQHYRHDNSQFRKKTATLELMDGIRMPRVVVQQKQTTGQALDSIRGGGAQDERVQVVEDPMVAVDARLMSLTCTATPVDDSGWWWQSWFHTPTEVRISFSDMTAVEASAECPYAQTTSPIKGSPGEPESTSVHVVRMDAPNQQMWIQCNNAEEQVQALTSFELLLKSAKRRSSDHTTQE
ncbi:hypothetical protein DYB32_007025 [Aphanomyces invadans]|uniref:Uncharacterized protein n=1 Tax=Aphanomyces invadans TaxID=157072 RepID=A0A3R6ZM69_9STRA|nr:hypothetical protein DYB32_007025 [Aphanomyces invadans]